MSLKKNFIYNIAYQLLVIVLPLLTSPYISRVVGAEGIGIYSYTYSIVNYFIIFSILGLNNYGNRSIAEVRDNKENLSITFCNIYSMQFIVSVIMIILYLIYIHTFVNEYKLIYYIQLILLISTLLDINWFFFGLEQFKLTVTRNSIVKLLTVVCIFLFVKDGNDLWIYTLILAIGTVVSQLMLWMFLKRYIYIVKPEFKEVIKHIKPNLVLFIPVLAISVYKIMDKIMLGSMTDMIQVAYYENSEKIMGIPMSIISALGVVMLPRMTNLNANRKSDTAMKYIEMSLKFIMFLAIGFCFGLIGVSKKFIPFFFGEEFTAAIPVSSLLAIVIIIASWANVIRTQYLIPRKKDYIYLKSTIIGAIINLTINIILIPKYGAVGAAIATIFAELLVAVYQTLKVRDELDINKYLLNCSLYIVPGIIMYILIYIISNSIDNNIKSLFLQVIFGGGIYLVISVLIMLISEERLRALLLKKVNYIN